MAEVERALDDLELRQLVRVPLRGEARGLDPTNAEVVEMHRQVYLLGLDHTKLTDRYSGRDFRLTDVHGRVVKEIIS